MGLNIKNERTTALIRELAAKTGQTMTAAIEDAVRDKLAELDRRPDGNAAGEEERVSAARLLAELKHSITPSERAALRAADAGLYDTDGLPR